MLGDWAGIRFKLIHHDPGWVVMYYLEANSSSTCPQQQITSHSTAAAITFFTFAFIISHKGKSKGRYSSTGCHLPYRLTQCYLPPDTSDHAWPNPSHAGWYSIYLPRRDGRLSWRSWLDSARCAPQPGVEPATFRSRVRRPATAPPKQLDV